MAANSHPKKPSQKQVQALFDKNSQVAIGKDSTIYYCPDEENIQNPRNKCQCPDTIAKEKTQEQLALKGAVEQKSPTTEALQKTYEHKGVRSSKSGTIVYCPNHPNGPIPPCDPK